MKTWHSLTLSLQAAEAIRNGAWGDELSLVAMCEFTGIGVKVYTITELGNRVINTIEPKDPDGPTIKLCMYGEFHYGWLRRNETTNVKRKAESKSAALPKAKRARKVTEVKPYDLSATRFKGPNPRSCTALPEQDFIPGAKDQFIRLCTTSMATGGLRNRTCTAKTAGMHWYTLRTFAKCIGAEPPVDPTTILTRDNVKTFFAHLEAATTIRKTRYSPGSISLAGRGLAVAAQVLLLARPLRKRENKKQQRRRMKLVLKSIREIAKSVKECVFTFLLLVVTFLFSCSPSPIDASSPYSCVVLIFLCLVCV